MATNNEKMAAVAVALGVAAFGLTMKDVRFRGRPVDGYQFPSPAMPCPPGGSCGPIATPPPQFNNITVRPLPTDPFQRALAEAKETGKRVLLFFTSDNCGWCVKMKQETFPAAVVREALEQVVFLEVGPGPLSKKYGITGYPSYVMLDGNEAVLGTGSGYLNAENFTTWIKGGDTAPQSSRQRVRPLSR